MIPCIDSRQILVQTLSRDHVSKGRATLCLEVIELPKNFENVVLCCIHDEKNESRGEKTMKIDVILAKNENKKIIKNLYPLYLYDLAEIRNELPNKYGIFEEDDTDNLLNQGEAQNTWFNHPENLFPYLIMVDDIPAGFAMVSTKRFTPHTCEFYLYEFFLARPFRGKGVAEKAAVRVFNMYRGKWELYTSVDNNDRAQSFWRRTLKRYTNGEVIESKGQTFLREEKIIFRFDNRNLK